MVLHEAVVAASAEGEDLEAIMVATMVDLALLGVQDFVEVLEDEAAVMLPTEVQCRSLAERKLNPLHEC